MTELLEKLSKPVSWKWTQKSLIEWIAKFKIDKVIYTVSFFRYDSRNDLWDFSFTAETKEKDYGYSRSGTGNAFKVYGTIVDIADVFLQKKNPRGIKLDSEVDLRNTRFSVNFHIAKIIEKQIEVYKTVIFKNTYEIFLLHREAKPNNNDYDVFHRVT